jgi:hypothetical protein
MLAGLYITRLAIGYSSLKLSHDRPIIRHGIKINAIKET